MNARPRLPVSLRSVLLATVLLASVAAVVAPSTGDQTVRAAGRAQASAYVAISPVRVLDTRVQGQSFVPADATLSIDPLVPDVIAAAAVDPLDVEAVAINLTITQPQTPGFLSSWPTAFFRPDEVRTSVVNNRSVNETIANFAIIPVGANGLISVRSAFGSHVIVDVQGVFARTESSRAGRFVPLAVPQRALDTRLTGETLAAGTPRVIDLTETVGVPRTASAGVINLVAASTREPGFLTAYPQGTVPLASNVNYPGGNYNIAGSAITRLDNGELTVFASGATDLIVDVVGYMTGPDDDESTTGLFVALDPARHYDSRSDQPPFNTPPLLAGQSRAVEIEGRFGVPASGVLGVAANLTMTATDGPGYLVAYPRDPVPPEYSTVNSVFSNHSIANHAIVALDDGQLSVFSRNRSDFVVDVTGYFLDDGAPVPTAPRRAYTDPSPNPDVVPSPVAEPPFDSDFDYLQRAGGPQATFAPYELDGSRYFGWDPCEPITYAINSLRATQEQVDALNVAIKIVEDASGFDFVYLGEARGSLNANRLDDRVVGGGSAMAVFGFTDPYENPVLDGGAIGLGGTTPGRSGTDTIEFRGQFAYLVRGGFAVADITDLSETDELINTFVHEIGHMVGLDHVNGRGEIMRPFISNPPQTTLGGGDRYGFWSIGAAQCGGSPLHEPLPDDIDRDLFAKSYGWVVD